MMQITCFFLFLLLACTQIPVLKPERQPASSITALEVIEKYIAVRGGRDIMTRNTSWFSREVIYDWDTGSYHNILRYSKAPGKSLSIIQAVGQEIKLGCDGSTAWSLSPRFGLQVYSGKVLAQRL